MSRDPDTTLARRREVLVARSALQRLEIAAHVEDLRERAHAPWTAALPALFFAATAFGRAGRVARVAALALVLVRLAARWVRRRTPPPS